MRFPILYKHKKIFVRYYGRWMNLSLEAMMHGGGFRGYSRFFYHWFRCAIGIHRIGGYGDFVLDDSGKPVSFERYTACMYCDKHKKVNHE